MLQCGACTALAADARALNHVRGRHHGIGMQRHACAATARFIVECSRMRAHVLHTAFARAQHHFFFVREQRIVVAPRKLHPLVFIYRSPTVKTEFRLHRKLFIFRWAGVQWHRVDPAVLARQSSISKEVSWT
jgi:hypothetical protein